ncbi:BUD22-domain-containing protein [Pyronema omphalodes]|nr:BUD22-domain-containing protein [Pyronema omphalodes]
MPKRKNTFSGPSSKRSKAQPFDPHTVDASSLPPRAVETIQRTIRSNITNGTKNVFRALKKVRGHETQKLVKRIKKDRTDRLEKELEAVKAIGGEELHKIAEEHVLRCIGKKKRITLHPLWPKDLTIPELKKEEEAKMNVLSRLYGAPAVKEAVTEVLKGVEEAMGIKVEAEAKTTKETADEDNTQSEENDKKEKKAKEANEKERKKPVTKAGEEDEDDDEEDEEDEEEEEEGENLPEENLNEDDLWDRLMDPNSKDFAAFEERIGASEDEDEGDDDNHDELTRTDDEWSGGSEAEDDDEDEKKAPELKKKTLAVAAEKPKKATKAAPAPPASSTFLPSLMSGYVSGGDSDPDAEWHEQNAKRGPPEKKERKNRMGQQARRALWEKKFGARANHVRQQQEKEQAKKLKAEKKKMEKEQEKKRIADAPMHPSWEAARKAKEKAAAMASAISKPLGKKITFD